MSKRTRTDLFISSVIDYLKGYFSSRATEEGIADIAVWETGYTMTLGEATEYPACIVLVPRKTMLDAYTVRYYLIVGIALSGDDPVELDALGNKWMDIIEDAVRADYSLGDSCIGIVPNLVVESDNVGNIFVLQARVDCDVDLGGFVYEPTEEPETQSQDLQEMRIQNDGRRDSAMPEMRQDAVPGDVGGQEEDASL